MNHNTIVITRPPGDEKPLADALIEQGARVIHEPLTEIFLHHTERQTIQQALNNDPDAILITSRHAIQALSILTDIRDLYLICVGDATADRALSLGFTRIATAGGTVDHMIDYITACYDEDAKFLYVSGEHTSTDIGEALMPYGMTVEHVIAYEAVASEQLSDTLVEQLRRKQVDAITFMSPRAARIFTALLQKAEAEDTATHTEAFCLSTAVAEPLAEHDWKAIHIADEPTLASMITCVNNRFTE